MIESDVTELATSAGDLQPEVAARDVITPPSRDARHADVHDDAFLAGFRDCSREAVRYLREHDVDASDLQRHLADVERTWLNPAGAGGGEAEGRDDSALGLSLVDDDIDEDTLADDVERRRPSDLAAQLSQNAHDLLRLAQNNPRINNILNQLFTLIDTDDDDDCDAAVTPMACDDDDQSATQDVMTSDDVVSDVS